MSTAARPFRLALTTLALAVTMAGPALAADAKLSALQGEVKVRTTATGAWAAAAKGMALPVGAAIKTGANARAEITYPDGTVARIAKGSILAINMPTDKGWGRLVVGKIWTKVAKGKGAKFVTPSATASVLGTELMLEVGEFQETKIIVLEGLVGFTGSLGDQVQVKGGFWGLAEPEQPMKEPQPTPPVDEIRKGEELLKPF